MTARRKIIRIDEEKCDGCGLCVPSCHEGAIQVIGGKARLVSDVYCDGLGDCLGHCPQEAITIEEREAVAYDEAAVQQRLAGRHATDAPAPSDKSYRSNTSYESGQPPAPQPQLANWPVQIHLVPVRAPHYQNARLLISADCVPFAYPDFHRQLLAGRTLLIGCPKLDEVDAYREKLAEILRHNSIESIDMAFMEVPCCFGLVQIVRAALADAGAAIPVQLVKIGIRGEVRETASLPPEATARPRQ